MTKYLDENGLLYLWGKLKATFLHNATEGRFTGVSTNTNTGLRTFNVPTIAEHIYYDSNKNSTLKDKIDTIVSQGGEPNTIETVKVNGTALVPDANKAVNITFTDSDTKNTAGSTNSNSKLYLVGATSQAANPQTYSRSSVYIGTDGKLRSGFGINNATDTDSTVATLSDITYEWSSYGNVIPILDKDTGRIAPSDFSFTDIYDDMIKGVNGVGPDSNTQIVYNYVTCNTAANVATKQGTLALGGDIYIDEGTQIVVNFQNKNTASNPTIKIGNSAESFDEEIHINGGAITAGLNASVLNGYVLLEYDGTYWNVVGPATTDSIVYDGGGNIFN